MPCEHQIERTPVEAALTPVWRFVAAFGGLYEATAIITQALQRQGHLQSLPTIPTISDLWEVALFVENQPATVRWGLRIGVGVVAGMMLDHLYRKERKCCCAA